MSGRLISPLLAILVGVGSGVYIFKPLLESYAASTGGSFRPADDHHSAPVPPLPMTQLQRGKTPRGEDLGASPKQAVLGGEERIELVGKKTTEQGKPKLV
ncbi:BQ2448_3456 [Microbotryum intermedium]|uniref:BQ2448_3456 protein n=1 Tax=Microbotryum intermedium TaxID=269621 RepID=A0A238FFP1_9BASI|nr:BQ2448_3456 [Microbotryum intermedium]